MHQHIFIDETGSPQFYAKRKRPLWTEPNFAPIICLGMVSTQDRQNLRKQIVDFQNYILGDVLFKSIYSVRQPGWYLHACIGRKLPEIFTRKHNGSATEFYFDLIHKLLAMQPLNEDTTYHLFLSQRQSNPEQRFADAIEKVLASESKDGRIPYKCTVVRSRDFPELSVVDYLLWALQRYILQGEKRYFEAMEHHYSQILDIYENDGIGRLYTLEDQFDLEKASPFK